MNGVQILTRALPLAIALTTVLATSSCGFLHRKIPGEHGPACSDIRAAASATFSSDAAAGLKKIAARDGMSAHEQIHLIDAAMRSIDFSSDKADVLVILAANKSLTPSAREDLSYQIRSIGMSSDQRRVSDALINNPHQGALPEKRKNL